MLREADLTRVFNPRGEVAHLLGPTESPNGNHGATLCNRVSNDWLGWRGTGTQLEVEKAARLRTCGLCAQALRRSA